MTVVIPNSLPLPTMGMMFLTALLAWRMVDFNTPMMRVVWMHVASSAVTLLYLAVGMSAGAPNEAFMQILFIYIISPALWILIAGGVLATLQTSQFESWMERYTFLGMLSVALFFYLFLTYGKDGVSFFIDPENANVSLSEGAAGATMFVYGSLIFMSAALFALLASGVSNIRLYIMLGLLAITAVTSGRSALMLATPVGLLAGYLLRPGLYGGQAASLPAVSARQILLAIGLCVVFFVLLGVFTDIDVFDSLGRFMDEVGAGGGSERTEQAAALFNGFVQTYGLGAGHGIGVSYIRSLQYPWRYEIVWLALLYKVGLAGLLVYAYPFASYALGVFNAWKRRRLTLFDIYLFAGFSSAFLASATNPYIEAYAFQWMYVLPMVIFMVRHPGSMQWFGNRRQRHAVVRQPLGR